MSVIKQLVESRKFDNGGDYLKGLPRAASQIMEMMIINKATGQRELDPSDLSVRELLDLFVIDKLRSEGKDVSALLSGSGTALREAITTYQFPRLLGRMGEVTILEAYELALEGADALVTEHTSNQSLAFFNRLQGDEQPELVYEGDAYEESTGSEFEVSVKARKYGRIIKLTRELVLADRTGQILDTMRNFGMAMGVHRQTEIIQAAQGIKSTVHDGAAVDTFVVNGTGYAIFSTDHSAIPGSGGYTNVNSLTGTALSAAGLNTALVALRGIVNIHGEKIRVRPTHLLVAPAQEQLAWKLHSFNTEPGLTSGGADSNVYKGKYLPVVDPDGVAGTWYIGDFKRQLRYHWNWKPMVETAVPTDMALTNDIVMVVKSGYKGGCGNVDHRFTLKSVA